MHAKRSLLRQINAHTYNNTHAKCLQLDISTYLLFEKSVFSQLKMEDALLKMPSCTYFRVLWRRSVFQLRCFAMLRKMLIVFNFDTMWSTCSGPCFTVDDFVPLLCFLLLSVAIVQAGCDHWSIWYFSRPSSSVIGQLGKKRQWWALRFTQS